MLTAETSWSLRGEKHHATRELSLLSIQRKRYSPLVEAPSPSMSVPYAPEWDLPGRTERDGEKQRRKFAKRVTKKYDKEGKMRLSVSRAVGAGPGMQKEPEKQGEDDFFEMV